jgi:cellulose biosynthesis protein BcsQ
MTKVICIASAKGGSGKTILTATFGAFLATALNKKVLLVDTDAATNGLTLMYLKEVMKQGERAAIEDRIPRGTYNLTTTAHDVDIVELSNGVHLIPATYSFINTEKADENEYESSLNTVISSFRSSYDYVFIDAQAGSDVYAQIAMKKGISDEVVIVSEYDPMSAAGVERLKGGCVPLDLRRSGRLCG